MCVLCVVNVWHVCVCDVYVYFFLVCGMCVVCMMCGCGFFCMWCVRCACDVCVFVCGTCGV